MLRTNTIHYIVHTRTGLLFLGLFGILIFLSSYVRLHGITTRGIFEYDGYQYVQVAKWWTEGNYTLDGFYRPAIYFLDSLAIRAFGYNDYSVALLHALMDIGNLLLIVYITTVISKNKWLGLCAASLYALYPEIVTWAYAPMAHIPSTTFVLLSLVWYLKFQHHVSIQRASLGILYLILSALSLSVATHIHPDLGFFAPVYLLLLSVNLRRVYHGSDRKQRSMWLKYGIIYTLVFFSLFIISLRYYGVSTILTILRSEISGEVDTSYMEKFASLGKVKGMFQYKTQEIYETEFFWIIMFKTVAKFTSLIIPIASIAIVPYMFLKRNKHKENDDALIPPILICGYGIIGSLLLTRYVDRLILPILPLVFITIVVWYDRLLVRIFSNAHVSIGILVAVSILIGTYNLYPFRNNSLWDMLAQRTVYNEIYSVMQSRVNEKDKILITPYIIYSRRKVFQAPYYFGGNARYIIDFPYTGSSLVSLMRENDIAYVFISRKNFDQRIITDSSESPVAAGRFYEQVYKSVPVDFYGLRLLDWEHGYTYEKEMALLTEFLHANNAQKIYDSTGGIVYQVQ